MAALSVPGVRRIADARAPWCVTVYGAADAWLRGNHPTDTARAQIRAGVHALLDAGAPATVTEGIRSQLEQLTKAPAGQAPSGRRIKAVGIFATPKHTDLIHLTTTPAPWVGISDRFLIGPLLEGALAQQPAALILAASESRVRLIDATTHPASVIEVPDLPENLHSSTRLDLTGDRNTLAHLRTSEDPKERLREYSRDIHRAVEPVRRTARAVLVLAATEPLLSALRSTAPASAQIVGQLDGNHDDDTPELLAELADPTFQHHRARVRTAKVDRLAEARPETSVHDVDAIERALADGSIDTLFIDTDWRAPADHKAGPAGRAPDRGDELIRRALASGVTIIPVHSDSPNRSAPVTGMLRHARTH